MTVPATPVDENGFCHPTNEFSCQKLSTTGPYGPPLILPAGPRRPEHPPRRCSYHPYREWGGSGLVPGSSKDEYQVGGRDDPLQEHELAIGVRHDTKRRGLRGNPDVRTGPPPHAQRQGESWQGGASAGSAFEPRRLAANR
jgi:hypothetical protein